MWNESLENLVVVKRSGQRVDFNASKIAIAIKKAFDAVYDEVDEKQIYSIFEKVLKYINTTYKDRKTINVEDIQDIIENNLNELGYQQVYNAFHEYRIKRSASRKVFNEKQQHKFVKVIENIENVDSTLTPKNLMYKFGRIISSEYAKSYVIDTKYIRSFEEGNIYIHNLEYFPLGYIPYVNLKLNISTDDEYLDEFISNIINSQNEISHEVGISNIDILLEKFIINYYKTTLKNNLKLYMASNGILELIGFNKLEDLIDKLNDVDISSDYFQAFISNKILKNSFDLIINETNISLNNYIDTTINRIFNNLRTAYTTNSIYTVSVSSINTKIVNKIKLSIISYLSDNNYIDNVHVTFKIDPLTNDEYLSKIATLIINEKNISLSFPKNSYNIDPNNEVEYFSNGIRLFDTANDSDRLANGRMVVASTSINLARLGLKYTSNNNMDFYKELDQILEYVKNEMLLVFENTGNKNKNNYQALFTGNILGDERLEQNQKIRKIIKSGTLNIGVVGLKECILCLEKDPNKQYKLLIEILNYINKKIKQFNEETKLCFTLFEPSGISCRKYLIGIDKSIYGSNKNITDKPIYELIESASFIPDYKSLAEVQKLLNGGSLITIKITNKTNNKKIVDITKELIKSDIGFVKIKVGNK